MAVAKSLTVLLNPIAVMRYYTTYSTNIGYCIPYDVSERILRCQDAVSRRSVMSHSPTLDPLRRRSLVPFDV